MASITKNPDDLSEQARKRLGTYFVKDYEAERNKLVSLTLDPKLEQILIQRVKKSQFDVGLAMDPELTQGLIEEIVPKIDEMSEQGLTPCLVTTSDLRLALRRFLEPSYPQLAILAFQEIPSETMVEPFASITLPQLSIPSDLVPSMQIEQDSLSSSREPELVS
jgi:flagellar biosynthesis protein FlhA